jgi:excisionase family DNA binding protein
MQQKTNPDLPPATDAITAPVDKFCVLSGLGKNTVYQMIGDGRLASIKIGRRRLVVVDSYRRLIQEEQAAQRSRR